MAPLILTQLEKLCRLYFYKSQFSSFYGQRLVLEAWTNPSPWSVSICFVANFQSVDHMISLDTNIQCIFLHFINKQRVSYYQCMNNNYQIGLC